MKSINATLSLVNSPFIIFPEFFIRKKRLEIS